MSQEAVKKETAEHQYQCSSPSPPPLFFKTSNARNYTHTLNHTFVFWSTIFIKPDIAPLLFPFPFFECTSLFLEVLFITIGNVVNDYQQVNELLQCCL